MQSQYIFVPYKDHDGDDICLNKKSIHEMMTIASSNPKCVGFNTNGWFKHKVNINTLVKVPNFDKTEGIYIKESLQDNYSDYFESIKTVCFIHSCTLEHTGTTRLIELLDRIKASGLLEHIDQMFIVNIGLNINIEFPKSKVINYSNNPQLWEIPTINLIHTYSKHNPNVKLLYLHTKGITHTPNNTSPQKIKAVNDWINLLLYCCVDNYDKCIKLLDKYDTVSCEYSSKPVDHYSGNFWWANTNYIKDLNPIITTERYDAEFWVLSKPNVNYFNIISTNLDHFRDPVSIETYKQKMVWV